MTDRLTFTVTDRGRDRVRIEVTNGEPDAVPLFVDWCRTSSSRSRTAFAKSLQTPVPAASAESIEKELLRIDQQERKRKKEKDFIPDPFKTMDKATASALDAQPENVRQAAEEMLRAPDLVQRILEDFARIGVVGEHRLALSIYLVGTSRLQTKPLAATVQGSSSSGKSHTIDRATRLMPTEATLQATDFTANALYYLPEGSLRHRFVVAGERSRSDEDDAADVTRAFREMISSGVLRKALPIRRADGELETRVIESEGPIAYVESTTQAAFFEEDMNRVLLLGSDDSSSQTRRILDAAGEAYESAERQDVTEVLARHHALQRTLKRVRVVVPFARALTAAMPADRPEARRAAHQTLGMVQAVAILHQAQRADEDLDHGSVIAADLQDYAIARALLVGPLGKSLGSDLPEHVVSFATWLAETLLDGERFTVGTLVARPGCRWEKTALYGYVPALERAGVIVRDGDVGRARAFRLVGEVHQAGAAWLPTLSELGAPAAPPEQWKQSRFLCQCWDCVSGGSAEATGTTGNSGRTPAIPVGSAGAGGTLTSFEEGVPSQIPLFRRGVCCADNRDPEGEFSELLRELAEDLDALGNAAPYTGAELRRAFEELASARGPEAALAAVRDHWTAQVIGEIPRLPDPEQVAAPRPAAVGVPESSRSLPTSQTGMVIEDGGAS